MADGGRRLSILMIGAHPDDCELKGGGTAVKWAKLGHSVRFVAMTGGDNGHPSMSGSALQHRRRGEARQAGEILGLTQSDVLENHGGELLPTLEARRDVVRLIREARADIVISHRVTDYHPDHRYTGTLVQDAAYMVTVPFYVPSVPALERNPVFLSFDDRFTRPAPFVADIAVDIDDVFDHKMSGIEDNVSQMYEWTPFMLSRSSGREEKVPEDLSERRKWLANVWFPDPPSAEIQRGLEQWYGEQAKSVRYAEAFEICEYGRQINRQEIAELFPFLPCRPA